MTKRIQMILGLTLLFTAVSASAQIQQTIHTSVPFTFVAAGKAWPAADYNIRIAQPSGLVTLTTSGVKPASFLTNGNDRPQRNLERTFLKFRRYGDHWILEEVAYDGKEQLLIHGKMEREMAQAAPSGEQTLLAIAVATR